MMRVFIIQKALGLFASSGEYKANMSVLRYFASNGHVAGQFCFALDGEVSEAVAVARAAGKEPNLVNSKIRITSTDDVTTSVKVWTFTNVDGIHVVALDAGKFRDAFPTTLQAKETGELIEKEVVSPRIHAFMSLLNTHLHKFEPTHIMFSDPLSLKATATSPQVADAKRIFIIHCAEQLPFGPYAGGIADSACSPNEHNLLRRVDGIWSVSQAIKDYAAKYGQLETKFLVHHPWTYFDEKTHELPRPRNNWDKELIGMINPSRVKGVNILLDLAKRLEHRKFAAWRSWAFNEELGKKLEALPNMDLRPTTTNVEEIWQDIKILIVPSLWLEAWGMVVVEAHLRGIPVISSDAGALPEAQLGLPSIVHVNMLTGDHDENGDYIVPDQDIEPWVHSVEELMDDKDAYNSLSNRVRTETVRWLTGLNDKGLENWMESVEKKA